MDRSIEKAPQVDLCHRDGFDWDALTARAVEAATHAYAPYSHYPVGAAAVVDDGRVITGCNVENASYGSACARSAGWSPSCT